MWRPGIEASAREREELSRSTSSRVIPGLMSRLSLRIDKEDREVGRHGQAA